MAISMFRGHLRLGFLPTVLLSLCTVSPELYAAPTPTSPFLPAQGSTSPSNGDLNPYGLAVVPAGFPGQTLTPGQLLVSNFNNGTNNSSTGGNVQGQGTTIVIIEPSTGQQKGLFFKGNSPIGFTNALGIVKAGFVFAGSVFTTSSNPTTPNNGGLLVFDQKGTQLPLITSKINGPWGLAVNDRGSSAQLFVSNVLDGTVTRLNVSFKKGNVSVDSAMTIAFGYTFGPDDSGLVVGPAGLAYDRQHDLLYVASENDNKIFAVPYASIRTDGGTGDLVFSDSHLQGPLGLILAPNGHLITANADPTAHNDPAQPSELVEFTKSGKFVREFSIDSQQGGAFAILNVPSDTVDRFAYVAILNVPSDTVDRFAYVDDVVSTITILTNCKDSCENKQ